MADAKIPISVIKDTVLAVRALQTELARLAQLIANIGARLDRLEVRTSRP